LLLICKLPPTHFLHGLNLFAEVSSPGALLSAESSFVESRLKLINGSNCEGFKISRGTIPLSKVFINCLPICLLDFHPRSDLIESWYKSYRQKFELGFLSIGVQSDLYYSVAESESGNPHLYSLHFAGN
jgi:hypothetical protein